MSEQTTRLVLPPGMRPAGTRSGGRVSLPARLPEGLTPAPVRSPGDRDEKSVKQIEQLLRQLSGVEPYTEDESPAEPEPKFAPAPEDMAPWEFVNGARRYLYLDVDEMGAPIAVDRNGSPLVVRGPNGDPLLDKDGYATPIWVDEDGFEIDEPDPEPEKKDDKPEEKADETGKVGNMFGRLLAKVGSGGRTTEDESDLPQLYDENGVPIADMSIVKAGSPLRASNKRVGARILGGAIAGVGAIAALALITGVVMGTSRVPAQGAISEGEAEAYGLSTFPVDAASAFAQSYLETCLTHGDTEQNEAREDTIKRMSNGAGATACGWKDGGNVQAPAMVTFNGDVDLMEKGFDSGEAAYLGFDVLMNGEQMSVTVPVWTGTAEGGSLGMQVVGDIGIGASTPIVAAPQFQEQRPTDNALASKVTSGVLEPFFSAWSSGNRNELNLVLSKDASTTARTPLGRTLTNPNLSKVTVFTYDQPDQITYADDDVVVAELSVRWDVPSSESKQDAAYRVELVMESSQWRVLDVQPGKVGAGSGGGSMADQPSDSLTFSDTGDDSTSSAGGETSGRSSSKDEPIGGVDSLNSGSDSSGSSSAPSAP